MFLHLLARYTLCRSKLPAARSQKIPYFASSSNRLCTSAAAAEWCTKELLSFTARRVVGGAGPYGVLPYTCPYPPPSMHNWRTISLLRSPFPCATINQI